MASILSRSHVSYLMTETAWRQHFAKVPVKQAVRSSVQIQTESPYFLTLQLADCGRNNNIGFKFNCLQ